MTDEKFLEKLIRLAWDNGYEYQKDDDYSELQDVVFNYMENHYEVHFHELELGQDYWVNLERFIFDHDFIRVLCELKYKEELHPHEVNIILAMLAQSTDRVNFLKETFSDLVEGE